MDPMAMEPALLTVTKLQAGSNHNVIPQSASLAGTLRSTSPEVIDELWKRLEAVCAGVAVVVGVGAAVVGVAFSSPGRT